jgi:hypothetical protein
MGPETPSRVEEELVMRMAIAAPLIATKGYGAPEVEAGTKTPSGPTGSARASSESKVGSSTE